MSAPELYHFCAAHMLPSIKKQGLTLGKLPWKLTKKKVAFMQPVQWLTVNKDFAQSWMAKPEDGSLLKYDRNAYRITVVLPDLLEGAETRERVMLWHDFRKFSQCPLGDHLSAMGDPENWVCYFGEISPKYFFAIDKNPEPTRDLVMPTIPS